ncbi:hypothetical protein D4A92_20645 [Rhizobium rosettiformans]|uniref:Secreted protein n=1 Tax=Rhizobium rosettiformans TaxID=1368430 RepID=A0ABX7F2B3_9HYPH|nr:hypothetical protein D4A92_20645 [Rhizobium rosettiformans]
MAGALATGFAITQLHHSAGHDPSGLCRGDVVVRAVWRHGRRHLVSQANNRQAVTRKEHLPAEFIVPSFKR